MENDSGQSMESCGSLRVIFDMQNPLSSLIERLVGSLGSSCNDIDTFVDAH